MVRSMTNVGQVVLLRWSDAQFVLDVYGDEVPGPIEVCTVGLCLQDDDEGVTVASEWFPEDPEHHRAVTSVPRGMVICVSPCDGANTP